MATTRLWLGSLLLASLTLSLGACSTTDEPASSGATDPRDRPTSTSGPDERAEVTTAYLAAWDAFYAAANPPNPDHPDLPKYLAGPFLATVRGNLAEMRERGTAIRRGDQSTEFQPRVVELAATAAVIEDCWVDADVEFDLETGDVVNDDVLVGTATFRMVNDDGLWKAEDNTFETAGPFEPADLDRLDQLDLPCEPASDAA